MRRSLARLLGGAGHEVTLYATAEELLGVAGPALSGCLLLDLRLPGASGLELQERARRAGMRGSDRVPDRARRRARERARHEAGAPWTSSRSRSRPTSSSRPSSSALARTVPAAAAREEAELAELRARVDALTDRQREVWLRVIRGELNKQIAHRPRHRRAHGEAAPRQGHGEAGRPFHGGPRPHRRAARPDRRFGLTRPPPFTKGKYPDVCNSGIL